MKLTPSKKSTEKHESILLNNVEKDLEKDGINLFENDNVDEDYLILPRDLTEVQAKELGRYFNAFTIQKMWVRTVAGRTGLVVREIERKLDIIKSKVYSELPAKMSVKEKELRLTENPQAQNLIEQSSFYSEKLYMLNDYLNNLEDGIFNISREITRRNADFKEYNTEHNLARKRGR